MLRVEDWAEIRRLRRSEGLAISRIARMLGISRNTVKSALSSDGAPKYRRVPAGSVVDAVEPRIRELLSEYPTMPATVVAERIGWERSIRILSGRVAELRPVYLPPDPAGRTSYEPGEIAQCDFWFPEIMLPASDPSLPTPLYRPEDRAASLRSAGSMSMGDPGLGRIELLGSAQAWFVPVVRALAEDVARRADLDLDAIADLRMAVDEACIDVSITLVGHGGVGARLRCALEWDADQMQVTVEVRPALPQARVPTTGFGWWVLTSLVDQVRVSKLDDTGAAPGLAIWVSTKRQPR